MSILAHMLDDPERLNPVVAIFYARIFGTIMSKHFTAVGFSDRYQLVDFRQWSS